MSQRDIAWAKTAQLIGGTWQFTTFQRGSGNVTTSLRFTDMTRGERNRSVAPYLALDADEDSTWFVTGEWHLNTRSMVLTFEESLLGSQFVFDYTSADTVAGCFYVYPAASTPCIALTGQRVP
jgi:hypothetical protein